MQLYYHPLSTYSHKVLIALYEKNLAFDGQIVNLFDPEARAEYQSIYPMAKIPCLVDDDDHMVPESSIIIEYLDGKGGPRLIPEDPEQARKTRFKDRMYDLYLLESVATLLFQARKPAEDQDPERIASARQKAETMYMFIEMELAEQPFSNGSEFLLSDIAAAAGLFYASRVLPFAERPIIQSYWERLCSIPAVQRVHEEALPYVKAFDDAA